MTREANGGVSWREYIVEAGQGVFDCPACGSSHAVEARDLLLDLGLSPTSLPLATEVVRFYTLRGNVYAYVGGLLIASIVAGIIVKVFDLEGVPLWLTGLGLAIWYQARAIISGLFARSVTARVFTCPATQQQVFIAWYGGILSVKQRTTTPASGPQE